MKAPAFEYFLAESVSEVHEILAQASSSDLGAKILAGGQSLVPLMNFRLARPDRLIDINRLDNLRYHHLDEDHLNLGALCRHADIERDHVLMSSVGAIADAVPLIGHASVRNRGTVVGSLAHGDPLAEWISLALLFDATVRLSSGALEREVPAIGWLEGYLKTAAEDDELVEEVSFSLPGESEGSAFEELAYRHGDFCLVSAAASLVLSEHDTVSSARVVVAGLGSVPFRVVEVETLLVGEPAAASTFERAVESIPAVRTHDDVHATGAYRRHVIGVVTARALMRAARRAKGREE